MSRSSALIVRSVVPSSVPSGSADTSRVAAGPPSRVTLTGPSGTPVTDQRPSASVTPPGSSTSSAVPKSPSAPVHSTVTGCPGMPGSLGSPESGPSPSAFTSSQTRFPISWSPRYPESASRSSSPVVRVRMVSSSRCRRVEGLRQITGQFRRPRRRSAHLLPHSLHQVLPVGVRGPPVRDVVAALEIAVEAPPDDLESTPPRPVSSSCAPFPSMSTRSGRRPWRCLRIRSRRRSRPPRARGCGRSGCRARRRGRTSARDRSAGCRCRP